MDLFDNQIKEFNKLLLNSKKIVIIPHKDPDGDAIGSSMAWCEALRQRDFEARIISSTIIPQNLRWMSCYRYATVYEYRKSKAAEILKNADLFLFMDFNSLSRTGELLKFFKYSKTPRILIDHHPNPEKRLANVVFSDEIASSTCELCYDILIKMGFDITVDMAEALYSGIITDTGKLTYGSLRPQLYSIISSLTEIGANKDKVFQNIYQQISFDSIRLLGHSLCNKLEIIEGLPVAYISLSKEELDKYNYRPGNTEDFVNFPLTIKDITVAALFTERQKDYVKISFRSHGDIPINEFAQRYFNGGGHINASGGETNGTLEQAVEMFRQKITVFLKSINK